MRILIFNWRDIKNPEAGGAEVHLHEIFKRIAGKGNEVVLISSKFNGCEDSEIIDGIKVIRIGNKFNFNFAAAFYYLTKLRKESFDIVVDDISKIPLCSPLYIKKPLIAIVHHIHGRTLFRELPFFMASYVWLSEKILIPFYKTKKIVSVSESTKKELVEMGIAAKNIAVIHNGIMNHETMNYTKSKYPLVVYVGRIKAYKQLDQLIKAFKIVKGKVENSKLIIAGKGDQKPL
ncbi:MAG: glycosyltransferase family 4 protein, partial [Herbiconiux sp.]|nr:glycosyltransferase family 4 protein [Herbiconiux sp.]